MSTYVVLYIVGRDENRWSFGISKSRLCWEGRQNFLYLKNEEAT